MLYMNVMYIFGDIYLEIVGNRHLVDWQKKAQKPQNQKQLGDFQTNHRYISIPQQPPLPLSLCTSMAFEWLYSTEEHPIPRWNNLPTNNTRDT